MGKRSSTRERIMLAGMELFNKKGATNVSTVQLANNLKMSPGNLYYYFDNKEHLIRSIWMEMLAPKVMELFYAKDLKDSEQGLMTFFLKLSKYTYEYRFFYLDLPALLQNDPEMKSLYKSRSIKIMSVMNELIVGWEQLGIMNAMSSIERNLLIQNCWTLSQTGITYIDLLEESATAKDSCDYIVQHLYGLLGPHFTQDANKKNFELLKENGLDLVCYA